MEEKQRICEICNRRFANGKAMGGHMRSHMAKLPVATNKTTTNTQTQPYNNMSAPLAPLSSSSVVSCRWITNSRVHFFSNHPNEQSLDRESETDSKPTRRRSKRRRRCDSPAPQQPRCGFSDDEQAAMCLLKLSTDKWTPKNEIENMKEEEELVWRRRKVYKCETCKKTFRSYQALGGHRASHKHKKLSNLEEYDESGVVGGFECPHCDKVFESGQALAGHKKQLHFPNYYLGITIQSNSNYNYYHHLNNANSDGLLLDLNNLPAEEEEEDEEEVSTVSNAKLT